MDYVYTFVVLLFVVALIGVAAWLARTFLFEGSGNGGLFSGGRDKRIGLIEATSIDGRRKLLLIRRDDVEHLVMTGGPIDVVIETGIKAKEAAGSAFSFERGADRLASREPAEPVFGRPTRSPATTEQ